MKRLTLLGLLLSPAMIYAADAPKATDATLDELRVPVTPAFTLLGVTPTQIERPNTARALAVGLLSASERAGGDVPTNLAIEVAPYWWTDRPDLTFQDYYRARWPERMAQTFALSIGTSELATYTHDKDAEGTAVAIGVRSMILGGKRHPQIEQLVDEQVNALMAFTNTCVEDIPEPTSDEPVINRVTEMELSDDCKNMEQSLRTRANRVTALDKERVGLVLEAAAGTVTEIPRDDAGDRHTSKYGAWLTWSYRSSSPEAIAAANDWTVVALQRYLRDDIDDTEAFDVGGRVIYKSKANQWSVSYEYLQRFSDGDDDSSSSRVTLEYMLDDRYTLTAALGRDFRTDDGKSPLIAIAGISLGWGGPKQGSDPKPRPTR